MTAQQQGDHGAEVALLSACLWSKNARIAARRIVATGDFYEPWHEAIYDAMTALDRDGRAVDPVTLRAALDAGGHTPQHAARIAEALVEVTTAHGVPEAAAEYADIVHGYAIRRRVAQVGAHLSQRALDPAEPAGALLSRAVTHLTSLRDTDSGDSSAVSLRELMAVADDDTPSWVIPGLLERGDRMMLTGTEGVGKSALSRQLVTMAAAGLHPFTGAVIPPIRAYILDVENKPTQVRRQTRPLLDWLARNGADDPRDRVLVDALYPRRINLTSDRDLSWVHQTLDTFRPDVVVLGPIYRMSPKALQTDDDAYPFLAALDTLTERGCALIVEAHAGHSQDGQGKAQARSLRPRGSSALMGWPEFGYGLRGGERGLADLEPWRGDREQRPWPHRVMRAPGNRWVEAHPDDPGYAYAPPDDEPAPADPQGALI